MRRKSLRASNYNKASEQGNEDVCVSYETIDEYLGSEEPTLELFSALIRIYRYFKRELFDNQLPKVIFVHNRSIRAMGYFMPSIWIRTASKELMPEININPSILQLPKIEVCQTLTHEMTHHFQQFYGRPGKRGYHNVEFSRFMHARGLMCSSTGKAGGKVTGRQMSDYIIPGGPFEIAFNNMPDELQFPFMSKDVISEQPTSEMITASNEASRKLKVKYSCPVCGSNVWGQSGKRITCEDDKRRFVEVKPDKSSRH